MKNTGHLLLLHLSPFLPPWNILAVTLRQTVSSLRYSSSGLPHEIRWLLFVVVFVYGDDLEYGWNPSRNGLIKLHLSKYLDFHSFGMACFVTPVTPLYRLLVGGWNWSQNTTQNTTTTNGFGIPVLPVVVSNWRDNQSIKLSTFVSYSRLLMIGDMPTLILERNDQKSKDEYYYS